MIALIALLVLTGVALRGYLPGESRSAEEEDPTSSPAATIAVITVLGAAMVVMTIAIIATLRQPRTRRPSGGQIANGVGGKGKGRWPPLRVLMIALAVILAWLLIVVLLLRLSVRLDESSSAGSTAPSAATPSASANPAPPPSPAREPPAPSETGGDLFWYLFATTVVMVILWAAGIVVAIRRHRPASTPQPVAEEAARQAPEPPGAQPLALAAERGLAEMGDLSREPREAIIACYAAMEDALANAPEAAPQDSDTPSEVLARAVEHHAIHAGSATGLVDLFAEARFSPHVMTEEHREVAVRALQLVLAEVRSAA